MKNNDNKKRAFSGGMYAGLDVPVKLLDTIIVIGIVLMAVLIFG